MSKSKKIVYPYIPNSVEEIKKEIMEELGIKKIEELYTYIPEHLRFKGKMNLPEPLLSEIELKDHVEGLLEKNISTSEYISFLGGGCYKHYVPAVCDEINNRSEFLTAYCGDTYADHGKCQAIFEFTSLMGELVEMDVVGLATYDGGQATCTSLRMCYRITGRNELLVPKIMNPQILKQLKQYCDFMNIRFVDYNSDTGHIDIDDLKKKISCKTAAVYLENPSYLGVVEENGREIAEIAHEHGALFVVAVDPSSLGIIEAPVNYGADIVCGDIQCLGMHMGFGSGLSGFIASKDDPIFIMNFPNHFYSMYVNEKGEFGFSRSLNQRTSYYSRENAVEYLGTNTGLWAITAAVYLSLMGPEGMHDLGINIAYKTKYAQKVLSQIKGVKVLFNNSFSFKEFVLNFDDTGKAVKEINKELLQKGIFGGIDLSTEFDDLGNSSLYCVTELTKKEHIDRLAEELSNVLK